MKENWEKVTMITLDDKLDALRWPGISECMRWKQCNCITPSETERGALVSCTYRKCVAKGLEVDLATIMVKMIVVNCTSSQYNLERTLVTKGHGNCYC